MGKEMKKRLQQAGLWYGETADPEISISLAWNILAKVGLPARFGGRSQDGSYEYLIINPLTGDFLTSGKGDTLECAMCAAAINASNAMSMLCSKQPDTDHKLSQ